MRAWRRRASCANPADPLPWLLTITRNEALRHLARPREALLGDDPERPDADGPTEIERAPERIDVQRALAALDPEDRQLLHLRYAEDLTQQGVADRLSIPEGTVKVRLHRLRLRLRESLQP